MHDCFLVGDVIDDNHPLFGNDPLIQRSIDTLEDEAVNYSKALHVPSINSSKVEESLSYYNRILVNVKLGNLFNLHNEVVGVAFVFRAYQTQFV